MREKLTDKTLKHKLFNMAVPMTILSMAILGLGATEAGRDVQVDNTEKAHIEKRAILNEDEIWQKAFEESEKNRLGVIFEPINTQEETYNKLRISCNEFIEQVDKDIDTIVDVETIINEEVYVDGIEEAVELTKDIKEVKKDTEDNKVETTDNREISSEIIEQAAETGPIYLEDKIIIRYINDDGRLKIAAAEVDKKTSEITVSNKTDLDKKIKTRKYTQNNGGVMTEDEYLDEIVNTVVGLLQSSKNSAVTEYKKQALKYFTADGAKTVVDSRLVINKDNNIDTIVGFVEAGKSSTTAKLKDRIYMQIKVKVPNVEHEDIYGIILKINENNKIFDIDIV